MQINKENSEMWSLHVFDEMFQDIDIVTILWL